MRRVGRNNSPYPVRDHPCRVCKASARAGLTRKHAAPLLQLCACSSALGIYARQEAQTCLRAARQPLKKSKHVRKGFAVRDDSSCPGWASTLQLHLCAGNSSTRLQTESAPRRFPAQSGFQSTDPVTHAGTPHAAATSPHRCTLTDMLMALPHYARVSASRHRGSQQRSSTPLPVLPDRWTRTAAGRVRDPRRIQPCDASILLKSAQHARPARRTVTSRCSVEICLTMCTCRELPRI